MLRLEVVGAPRPQRQAHCEGMKQFLTGGVTVGAEGGEGHQGASVLGSTWAPWPGSSQALTVQQRLQKPLLVKHFGLIHPCLLYACFKSKYSIVDLKIESREEEQITFDTVICSRKLYFTLIKRMSKPAQSVTHKATGPAVQKHNAVNQAALCCMAIVFH